MAKSLIQVSTSSPRAFGAWLRRRLAVALWRQGGGFLLWRIWGAFRTRVWVLGYEEGFGIICRILRNMCIVWGTTRHLAPILFRQCVGLAQGGPYERRHPFRFPVLPPHRQTLQADSVSSSKESSLCRALLGFPWRSSG